MWNFKVLRYFITMLISFLGFHEVTCQLPNAEEGPYESVVHNTSNCVTERAWFNVNVSAFNSNGRSLLRGRAVIKRELKDVKFRIQVSYIPVEGSKVKMFDMKNQNCRNFIVGQVLDAIGARYDRRKCTMKPDTFEFNNLNLNKIFHSVVRVSLWYGMLQVRWEIAVPAAQVMCLDINIKISKVASNLQEKSVLLSKRPSTHLLASGVAGVHGRQ